MRKDKRLVYTLSGVEINLRKVCEVLPLTVADISIALSHLQLAVQEIRRFVYTWSVV